MEYTWQRGLIEANKLDACDAGQELHSIFEQFGELKTEAIVKRASNKDSLLHPAFTWNNSNAAHAHRLNQARDIARAIGVRVEVKDGDDKVINVFVHIPKAKNQDAHYTTVASLKHDPAAYARALSHLMSLAGKLEQAVENLREAAKSIGIDDAPIVAVHKDVTSVTESVYSLEASP